MTEGRLLSTTLCNVCTASRTYVALPRRLEQLSRIAVSVALSLRGLFSQGDLMTLCGASRTFCTVRVMLDCRGGGGGVTAVGLRRTDTIRNRIDTAAEVKLHTKASKSIIDFWSMGPTLVLNVPVLRRQGCVSFS